MDDLKRGPLCKAGKSLSRGLKDANRLLPPATSRTTAVKRQVQAASNHVFILLFPIVHCSGAGDVGRNPSLARPCFRSISVAKHNPRPPAPFLWHGHIFSKAWWFSRKSLQKRSPTNFHRVKIIVQPASPVQRRPLGLCWSMVQNRSFHRRPDAFAPPHRSSKRKLLPCLRIVFKENRIGRLYSTTLKQNVEKRRRQRW